MTFPNWAPLPLIDHYKRKEDFLNDHCESDEDLQYYKRQTHFQIQPMLLRLISDNRMQKVWKMLNAKRRDILTNKYPHLPSLDDERMALFLFYEIESSLIEMRQKKKTRVEESTQYQEIAKAAKLLSRLVKDTSLDVTPYRWFPDSAINTRLTNDIKPEKIEGYFCQSENSGGYKKGEVFKTVEVKTFGDTCETEYWKFADNQKKWFSRWIITPQHPNISYVVGELSEDANKLAKDAMIKPRIVEKPNAISKSSIFIKSLYIDFWKMEFGSPLYRTFATLCNVVLNDENITESSIRDALKNIK